ncbi:MAG: response regulator [Clostridiales bacterium]|jgi:PAS domain S-box-containing protein|nr:response regulator [Clostridiales bacterium]
MSYLNKVVLGTLSIVAAIFTVLILFVSNTLFVKSIENAKAVNIDNAKQITESVEKSFASAIQLLNTTKHSLSRLTFNLGQEDSSADDILISLLEMDASANRAWLVFDKGVFYKNRRYVNGFIKDGGNISKDTKIATEINLEDPAASPWFYEPLLTGNSYSNVDFIHDAGYGGHPTYSLLVSVPIYVGDKVIGVCCMDILYPDILNQVDDLHKKQNRVVMIFNKKTTILHASGSKFIGNTLEGLGFNNPPSFDLAIEEGKEYSDEIISPIIHEKVFRHLTPILINVGHEQLMLFLHIGTPFSELYAEFKGIIISIIIASALSLALIILIVYLSTNKILNPIKDLTKQAEKIASGDYKGANFGFPSEKYHEKNEIATLRRAFINMLSVLQEYMRHIERRVEERTFDLQKLNGYIKALMDTASTYSLLLDNEAKIVYLSGSLLSLAEVDGHDFIGMPVLEAYKLLFHDAIDMEAVSIQLSRVMSGENELSEDTAVRWPSGVKRLYRITNKKISDEYDNFDGIIIVSHDITELRIEEASTRLNDIISTTVVPCIALDGSANIIRYNGPAAQIFDAPDNLSPKEFDKFIRSIQPEYQADGNKSESIKQRLILESLEKSYAQANMRLAKAGGEPLYFLVNATRFSWLFEHLVIMYLYDVTDAIKKEEEAKEAEGRIKLMLDSTPLICILRDNTGNIIDCNQEALNVLGVPEKAKFLKEFHTLFPEYQPDGTKSEVKTEEMLQSLIEEESLDLERTFQTASGELIPVDTKIVRIPWKDSYYYLSFSRDLREVKAKEKEMQAITERERKAKLQKEAAQVANETKTQFLANMSHEIRTPMNSVLGMSELLLQEGLTKRQFRYVEDIKISAMALLNIINDILDVSKLQAGKLKLIPVHFDFKALIDNISSTVHFLIADKSISFKLSVGENVPSSLYGDDVRLRQMLLNLLSNAIKFTKEGYVKMSVSTTDSTIRVNISDTGIGIREENLETLFDAFEQADVLKNRGIKGTGLGLTITKSIAEMMGGSISVESIYGKGSSFQIEIPKILGDEALIHRTDNSDISVYAPGARILVVDDNPINLNVAYGLLRLSHIEADMASSGEEAIELVSKNKYDIIFMDHMMPEMDGVETTEALRGLGVEIPIIALTASAITGTKEALLQAGLDDYLSKPIIKKDLFKVLSKWIPQEKLLEPPVEKYTHDKTADEKHKIFWDKIRRIDALSISVGLDRVDGQWGVYEKTLKLMMREIEKCNKNLNEFLSNEDMVNFKIEVHGIKGALANVGALELSEKAFELERHSDKIGIHQCKEKLPYLTHGLLSLNSELKEAFSLISGSSGEMVIPPELPEILKNMLNAFGEEDLVLIDNEVAKLDKIGVKGALKEEIEKIKDAVMMMDYDEAEVYIQRLI